MSLHEALRLQVQDFDLKEWLKTHAVDELDDQQQTALHIACTEGNFAVVKTLIRKRANVNLEDSKQWTPLHCAASGAHYDICELLIQSRANVNAVTADQSCVMGYVAKGHRGDPSVQVKLMDLLLAKGSDIDLENKHKETPLLRAALVGSAEAVGWLLANGADSMAFNKYGETLLHQAVRSGRPTIVKLALVYGVDIFARSEGEKTAFDEAKEMGHEEVIAVLDTFLDGPNDAVKAFREELEPLLSLECATKKRRSTNRAARGSIYLSTGGNDTKTKELAKEVRKLLTLLQEEASAIAALPSGKAIVEQCRAVDALLPDGSQMEEASKGPAPVVASEEEATLAEESATTTSASLPEPSYPKPPPKRHPTNTDGVAATPPKVPQRRPESRILSDSPLSQSSDGIARRTPTNAPVAAAPPGGRGGSRGARGRGGGVRGGGRGAGAGRASGRALPTPPSSVGLSSSTGPARAPPSPQAKRSSLCASADSSASATATVASRVSSCSAADDSDVSVGVRAKLTRSASPPPGVGDVTPSSSTSSTSPSSSGAFARPTPPLKSLAPRGRARAASDCGNSPLVMPKSDTDVQQRIVAAEKMDIVAKLQAMANQQQAQPQKDSKKELSSSGKKAKKEKAGGSLLKKKGAISAGFATLKRSSVLKESKDDDNGASDSPVKERKVKAKAEPSPEPEPEPEVPKTDPLEYWNELNVPEPKLLQQPERLGENATAEDKQMQTRNTALEEIICTETQYVRSLAILIAFYLKPLRNDHGDLVAAADLKKIFSNVEGIHTVSSRLLAQLTEQVKKEPQDQRIGEIFLGVLKELSLYNTYCTNQVDSMTTLQDLRESRPEFVEFLEQTKQLELTTAEPVDGLLIKPFQRICRYVLLLKELHKRTPKAWEDKEQIKKAVEGIDGIVREANETKRVMDNLMKIQEIQEKLECDLDIKRAVKFVLEGDFKELDAKGHPEKRHFFLFNKLLIVAKPRKGGKFTMRDQIPVENCIIWDVADSGKVKHAFQIVRTDVTSKLVMICSSNAQKDNWMNAINECISSSGVFLW